jgi:hypothetical protein
MNSRCRPLGQNIYIYIKPGFRGKEHEETTKEKGRGCRLQWH